ncbi:hypothetical protein BDW59DRAFT_153247 [Aspergillus cavernicola]|uniref:60S acidic ribosomal protein P2 n=1 Tax=Aspergillus cavernicola TaxID=176166 RepID=A0ABR4HLS7_9EURO
MKHLAAYLLLTIGGNTNPSAEDIKEVLASVGIDADETRLTHLLTEVAGKNIDELIAEGTAKLATVIGSNPGHGTVGISESPEIRDDRSVEGGCCDDCGDEEEDFGLDLFG